MKAAIGYTPSLWGARPSSTTRTDTLGKLTDAVAAARDKVVQAAAKRAAQKAQATGRRPWTPCDRAGRAAQAAGGVRDAALTRFASGKVR